MPAPSPKAAAAPMRHRFAPMPAVVLRDARLSAGTKAFYANVALFFTFYPDVFPSLETLAALGCVTSSAARQHLRALRKRGLVTAVRRWAGGVNGYTLVPLARVYTKDELDAAEQPPTPERVAKLTLRRDEAVKERDAERAKKAAKAKRAPASAPGGLGSPAAPESTSVTQVAEEEVRHPGDGGSVNHVTEVRHPDDGGSVTGMTVSRERESREREDKKERDTASTTRVEIGLSTGSRTTDEENEARTIETPSFSVSSSRKTDVSSTRSSDEQGLTVTRMTHPQPPTAAPPPATGASWTPKGARDVWHAYAAELVAFDKAHGRKNAAVPVPNKRVLGQAGELLKRFVDRPHALLTVIRVAVWDWPAIRESVETWYTRGVEVPELRHLIFLAEQLARHPHGVTGSVHRVSAYAQRYGAGATPSSASTVLSLTEIAARLAESDARRAAKGGVQ